MSIDVEALRAALQANQDKTFLDERNHRYHCGGMCADAIAAEYARLAPAEDEGRQERWDTLVRLYNECRDARAEDEGRLREALEAAFGPKRRPDPEADETARQFDYGWNDARDKALRVADALAATPEPWTDPKG